MAFPMSDIRSPGSYMVKVAEVSHLVIRTRPRQEYTYKRVPEKIVVSTYPVAAMTIKLISRAVPLRVIHVDVHVYRMLFPIPEISQNEKPGEYHHRF